MTRTTILTKSHILILNKAGNECRHRKYIVHHELK